MHAVLCIGPSGGRGSKCVNGMPFGPGTARALGWPHRLDPQSAAAGANSGHARGNNFERRIGESTDLRPKTEEDNDAITVGKERFRCTVGRQA